MTLLRYRSTEYNMYLKFHADINFLNLFLGGCADAVMDLVLVIDSSSAVDFNQWQNMLQSIVDMLDHFTIGLGRTNVGVVSFGSGARSAFFMNTHPNRREVVNAIRNIQYRRGTTDIASALRLVYNEQFTSFNGAREIHNGVDKVVILLTAGRSAQSVSFEANTLKRQTSARVFTIGLRGASESEVREISSSPQQRDESYFTDVSYSDISRSLTSIEGRLCQTAVYCTITAEAGRVCFCGSGGCDTRSINGTQCQGKSLYCCQKCYITYYQ